MIENASLHPSPVVCVDNYVLQRHNMSCCCRLHAWFTHNQLTIIIKRLSKQTWAWVAGCCIMDTGRVCTLTHRVLRCEPLRFIAHGCRSQFSLQGPFVLFHYLLTQRKHWLEIAWAQDGHKSFILSFYLNGVIKFNEGFHFDLIVNTNLDSEIRLKCP